MARPLAGNARSCRGVTKHQEPVQVMAGIAMGLKCPVCAVDLHSEFFLESRLFRADVMMDIYGGKEQHATDGNLETLPLRS